MRFSLKIFATLIGALSLLPVSAQAASFTNSGSSSLTVTPATSTTNETITVVETRYFPVVWDMSKFLKAVVTTTRISGVDGDAGSSVALEMRGDGKARLDKVLWTANVEGSGVEVFNDEFIAVTKYGCCGASDTKRLFNIDSGKKVEVAVGPIYQIRVPNSQLSQRYLTLAVDSKAPHQVNGKTYMGTFSYFDANKVLSRIRVYSDIPAGWGADFYDFKIVDLSTGTAKIEERNGLVDLWGRDGQKDAEKAYGGFALEAKLSYDKQVETVQIVVDVDTLDEKASTATKGLLLVRP